MRCCDNVILQELLLWPCIDKQHIITVVHKRIDNALIENVEEVMLAHSTCVFGREKKRVRECYLTKASKPSDLKKK